MIDRDLVANHIGYTLVNQLSTFNTIVMEFVINNAILPNFLPMFTHKSLHISTQVILK